MSEFKNVTVVKKANIYFEGKVTSRTVVFGDGSRKTLGVMLPGEYVAAGQRILLLHNPKEVWVEANIKETQVGRLKLGQPVHISVDAYPDDKFMGRVARIGSATMARFALIPTPNPSGNFTKITQRVAVKIDMVDMPKPLTPGMMVEVDIDVR